MRVALGLGSNRGDRARTLKRAVVRLAHGVDAPLAGVRLARVYASEAVVPAGAPAAWRRPFLNTAVVGETSLDPEALLRRVKELERALGREPAERWAPRAIDIDLLWCDAGTVARPELVVPHPALLERSFALEPLRDLLPDVRIEGVPVAEHARRRRGEEEAPAEWDPEAELRVRYPLLMGILNVTPDSFSDGGLFHDPDDALARAEALLDGGAAILDVGGESTRPGGEPVSPAEERRRLAPVLDGLRELRRRRPFLLSLDSRRPEVVGWALEDGVDVVNDVTGFRDPEMRAVVRHADAELAFMHSLSVPVARGEALPEGTDPVAFLLAWGRERAATLVSEGIDRRRLLLDPGIGFGKSAEQSWRILQEVGVLHRAGLPLMVGHSRKSFLESVAGGPPASRDEVTVEVSLELARAGVEILRVHDPALHTRRFRARLGSGQEPWAPPPDQSRSRTRPSSSE
jgi:dihydropteroate synthase/2-amino-4-hydroxy-6-hydroxymethyldihydropteridine diphosphokinase